MHREYPSDVTRKQFEIIKPILGAARKKTKPTTIDLYQVFCAILYLLKSGCQWRMLPSDFPKWSTCYSYWRKWSKKDSENQLFSLLEIALQTLVADVRIKDGREQQTSFIIVDAQSVKNTDTAENKGYDGGKKVSGIKRHIGVDTNGLPHVIHVTTANVTDRAGALEAFALNKENLSKVVNVLVDGGYTGDKFANAVKEILNASVEVAKRNELHTFSVIPKRWVVERSFGWLEKCRRLWKNCERKLNTSLQMTVLGFLSLLLRRS